MTHRRKRAFLRTSQRCIPFSDVSRELLSRSHRPRTAVNLQGSVASWIRSAFTGVRLVQMPPAAGGVGKTRRSSLRSGPSLDEVAQTYFGPMSGRIEPVTVITRAADASEPAHSIDVEVAMRQASRHLSMTLKIPFRQERCSDADLLRSAARLRNVAKRQPHENNLNSSMKQGGSARRDTQVLAPTLPIQWKEGGLSDPKMPPWHALSRAIRRGLMNMKIQAYLTAAAVTGECLLSACCSCTAKKVPVQPTSAQAGKNSWNPLVASA